MVRPLIFVVAAAAALGAVRAAEAPRPSPAEAPSPSIVHEWGTFTSVAGPDGRAVDWTPQAGASDLPCFVVRNQFAIKGNLRGTVRMETPVVYFYASEPTRASVRVRFRGGAITEWFPPAAVSANPGYGAPNRSALTWSDVAIQPDGDAEFRVEPGRSHYYRARDTDAAPLAAGVDRERFLFYRGVGTFALPVSATVTGDALLVAGEPGAELGDVIVFDNHGGSIAWNVQHVGDRAALTLPSPPQPDAALPLGELEQILVRSGLFEREAHAMVETWRDSWFEEGSRLIYIVPQTTISTILPLDIEPVPSSLTRVFVGRVELVTPATLRAVRDAIGARDRTTLDRYGRFLEPIVAAIRRATPIPDRADLERQLRAVPWNTPVSDRCRTPTAS